jgi:hypothetical protein
MTYYELLSTNYTLNLLQPQYRPNNVLTKYIAMFLRSCFDKTSFCLAIKIILKTSYTYRIFIWTDQYVNITLKSIFYSSFSVIFSIVSLFVRLFANTHQDSVSFLGDKVERRKSLKISSKPVGSVLLIDDLVT